MMTSPLRLAFMGTPDFSVPILSALIDAGHEVAAVYCQPPRAAGRGQKKRLSPVHAAAEARGIEVRTPKNFKDDMDVAAFAALDLDAAVVAAYGLILPASILTAPRLGCLNVHASLLPRWRGAAPIQRAILAGDRETGVTIMQMDEGLDTGDMLLHETIAITPAMNAGGLHDVLSEMGAELIVKALAGLSAGKMIPIPQPADGVTYAQKIDKGESRIDWIRPADEISRQVRAFTPWPGAWFDHAGTRIKILAATPVSAAGSPGTLLDEALTVACGEGAISISRLQRAGKGPMAAGEFLKGYDLPAGTVLG